MKKTVRYRGYLIEPRPMYLAGTKAWGTRYTIWKQDKDKPTPLSYYPHRQFPSKEEAVQDSIEFAMEVINKLTGETK